MTVKQMLSSLDSRELGEWIAFFRLEEKKRLPSDSASDERIKAFFRTRRNKK